ncbi:MAG: TRAP transporter small permease [Kiritimatiellia bacterium]
MGALNFIRGTLVRFFEILVSVLVALLTIVVLWGVFTRYMTKLMPAVGGQAEYTEELARLLLIWVSTFGAALAFERKSHLGVDFFMGKLHPEAARIVAVVVQVLIVVFAVTVFIIGGSKLTYAQMGQKLATMDFMTRGFVYMAFPLSGVFITLFSLENMLNIIRFPAVEEKDAVTEGEG